MIVEQGPAVLAVGSGWIFEHLHSKLLTSHLMHCIHTVSLWRPKLSASRQNRRLDNFVKETIKYESCILNTIVETGI